MPGANFIALLAAAAPLVAVAGCSLTRDAELPPFGEALIVVDTDLPVPRIAGRLRIDVLDARGALVDTRDDARPDPRDWPVSFSVFVDDAVQASTLFVRLRAYPEARRAGSADEPLAALTVDRLVRVDLVYGSRGRVRVRLDGACVGQPSVLPPSEPMTCSGGGVGPVLAAATEPTLSTDLSSEQGTFAAAACDATANGLAACVPGGPLLFGDAFYTARRAPMSSRPERVVTLSRFWIDVREVTVGRFRAAQAAGFSPPFAPIANERDLQPTLEACTFSAAPRGREDFPLNCVTWETARAFCKFEGGDLPSEAQWEHAALSAGRPRKVTYPWGDEAPTCSRAVYGRSYVWDECEARSLGPQPLGESEDVSAVGVRDLAGSMSELVRDSFAALDAPCRDGAVHDPVCTIARPPACADPSDLACPSESVSVAVRGGSWFEGADDLRLVDRTRSAHVTKTSTDPTLGFRCVYDSAR